MSREEMTNEEAIAIMLSYDGCFIGYSSDEVNEAIDTVVDMMNNWDWLKSELIRRIEILNMEREDRNIGLSYVNGQLSAYHSVLKLMGVERNE